MSSTEKKPRLVSVNPILADDDVIKHFREAYTSRLPLDEKVIKLEHEPFSYCVIDDFLIERNFNQFSDQLSNELRNIKYNQKNNDLYKFQQTEDLANVTLPAIEQIKQFLYVDFKDWLSQATDIRLTDKVDLTSSKYDYTDYLLCHDDDIHGTIEGRRIAFIYYLVPDNWQETDGGTLDLFETDNENQPCRIVKSLVPKRNRLTFFEVTDKSYHQVSEVLNAKQGTRLSINGWLHGPVNSRSTPVVEPFPVVQSPNEFQSSDLDRVNQTITPIYLKVETQYDVQTEFQENSEAKLSKFFQKDYFQAIINELQSDEIKWIRRGPYNKRNYDVADVSCLPSALKTLIELFGSEPMFTILGSLTGLTSANDEDEETTYEPSPKKQKAVSTTENAASTTMTTTTTTTTTTITPRWFFELRRWKHTYYSLSYDTNNNDENNNVDDDDDDEEEEKDGLLDVMIFFNSRSDESEEAVGGGDVVYTSKNEDETLLRVIPEDNSLNLIYREDDKVLKFTKYINHRQAETTFYEFSASYLDLDKLKIE